MLLTNTERGLYCEAGDFYIDPWRPVDFAMITHAHSDHARWGSRHYLTSEPGRTILQLRLGPDAKISSVPYGETISRNGVTISFHPAGHVLGSAQIRVEHKGEIWVVSGDYKTEADGISGTFEPVRCHTFVTESTFALPIYRWRPQLEVFAEINAWWRENQSKNRTSVVFAYSLGKAQRVLSGLDGSIGPVFVHGAAEKFVETYQRAGAKFPPVTDIQSEAVKASRGSAIVVAPGSADNSPWLRKFGEVSTAFASGWMRCAARVDAARWIADLSYRIMRTGTDCSPASTPPARIGSGPRTATPVHWCGGCARKERTRTRSRHGLILVWRKERRRRMRRPQSEPSIWLQMATEARLA